jgi:hypothetical protein
LKLSVTEGNCPWWLTDNGATVCFTVTSSLKGTMPELCDLTKMRRKASGPSCRPGFTCTMT